MDAALSTILSSDNKIFLHGEACSGKTGFGCQRLKYLLSEMKGEPEGILVLVSQRSLASPYQEALKQVKTYRKSEVSILTMSGLVRRMVNLFWPLIGHISGFYRPYEPPSFLTLETSQYYMGRIVDPMILKGYFSTVSLTRNRLLSQLVDNLNKAAIVGFPYTEIGKRLSEAWVGQESQKRVYEDAQEAVNAFRAFCLQNNLLDYSLQVELFKDLLWTNPIFRKYLNRQYVHLIYDNAEEDPPYVHDIVADWWKDFKSALVIQDDMAGYHSFLGADPQSASKFKTLAEKSIYLQNNTQDAVQKREMAATIIDYRKPLQFKLEDIHSFIKQPDQRVRFYPELLELVARDITEKVRGGVSPNEIVVISPFVSDSTIFTLEHELAKSNINLRSLRPSTSLRDEPVIQILILFAILAHPEWDLSLDTYRITSVLAHAIPEFDLVRAHLITKHMQSTQSGKLPHLADLPQQISDRLNEEQKDRYLTLTNWIEENKGVNFLDDFFSRLFGELLSQPGFGFHLNLESGSTTAQLITSYKKFRASFGYQIEIDQSELAKEFVKSVESGLLAATFVDDKSEDDENAILITPVMSFLGLNQEVDYQYWLNIGSSGWYERLEQPLTHPIVLSRIWQVGEKWTADHDQKLSRENLEKTLHGLFNRCRKEVFLANSDFSESGMEEKGLLTLHIQALFRRALKEMQDD